jgi:CRP/FNR family transcriptional regulator, nitrogen oxide reductase regulator
MDSERMMEQEGNFISSPNQGNIVQRLSLISSSPLFANLSERECLEIASYARTRTFTRNEPLFSQGQPVRELILLQSGSVKHTQVSSSGHEVLFRFSRTGDVVNLHSESRSAHTCSVRATEPGKALIWELSRIQSFLLLYPEIRGNISRILTANLEELEERFREVATETVSKRLAFALLRLLKQIGKPSSRGIEIPLSREELAQMTGATLFTISRVLSGWSEKGFLLSRRESVVIIDPSWLEAMKMPAAADISPRETAKHRIPGSGAGWQC